MAAVTPPSTTGTPTAWRRTPSRSSACPFATCKSGHPRPLAARTARLATHPALHLGLEHRQRQGAVAKELVVEGAEVERGAQRRLGLPSQRQDLELADLVAKRLAGPRHVALDLALVVGRRSAQVVDGLLARPALGMKTDVDDQPRGAEQLGPQHPEPVRAIGVDAQIRAQALRVERPALAERRVPAETAERRQARILALQRHLEVMTGHGLLQVEVTGHGRAAAAAKIGAVEIEDARARAVRRRRLVARRHRALAE